ncbi:hypothetical protein GCM10023336_25760 [Streptomyces similanensis]|uniref:Uncharacterized protein n=1 Tax=Streptomyces similanensis TaxID=1274988 RepID=A0ABP9KDC5_9ACTN
MEVPIRSRLLDYIEYGEAEGAHSPPAGAPERTPGTRRSALLDYTVATPTVPGPAAGRSAAAGRGVPPYHAPVFVPAHPRYVDAADATGRTVRVPLIAYELFAHPAGGAMAFAFSTLGALVAALGEAQPWIAASLGPLAEGLREHGATVLLDPRVAPGQENWQPADLASYARRTRP